MDLCYSRSGRTDRSMYGFISAKNGEEEVETCKVVFFHAFKLDSVGRILFRVMDTCWMINLVSRTTMTPWSFPTMALHTSYTSTCTRYNAIARSVWYRIGGKKSKQKTHQMENAY